MARPISLVDRVHDFGVNGEVPLFLTIESDAFATKFTNSQVRKGAIAHQVSNGAPTIKKLQNATGEFVPPATSEIILVKEQNNNINTQTNVTVKDLTASNKPNFLCRIDNPFRWQSDFTIYYNGFNVGEQYVKVDDQIILNSNEYYIYKVFQKAISIVEDISAIPTIVNGQSTNININSLIKLNKGKSRGDEVSSIWSVEVRDSNGNFVPAIQGTDYQITFGSLGSDITEFKLIQSKLFRIVAKCSGFTSLNNNFPGTGYGSVDINEDSNFYLVDVNNSSINFQDIISLPKINSTITIQNQVASSPIQTGYTGSSITVASNIDLISGSYIIKDLITNIQTPVTMTNNQWIQEFNIRTEVKLEIRNKANNNLIVSRIGLGSHTNIILPEGNYLVQFKVTAKSSQNFIIQSNNISEILMLVAPIVNANDLVYTGGGGTILANLKNDLIQGGFLYHGGNPLINVDYTLKGCSNMIVNSTNVQTESNLIDKGLIYYEPNSDAYFWSEVYTTPLGFYKEVNTTPNPVNFEFSTSNPTLSGNQLLIAIKDMNVLPKAGDYIVIQKVLDDQGSPSLPSNSSYTDDIDSLPVSLNSELYQFKITQSLIESGSGISVLYRLYLDKSIKLISNGIYSIVLLNRENTGIQKELFYDTFEQIEIQRDQLLGDPYNNTNNFALPMGRKNYLKYNSAAYLGLGTLLKNIINVDKTPFIVYDISDEIRDRFVPKENTFEMLLPFVMIQEDNRTGLLLNKPQKIVNSGINQIEENGVGIYCALYFNWDIAKSKRIGWIFYDLRIVVFDDSELATALSYNSNRNYTLPLGSLVPGIGNDLANSGGGSELIIDTLEVINTNQVVVKTTILHNLINGTEVFISDAYVLDINNNIIPSSANGTRFIKLLNPNDPFKFQLFDDIGLTIPIISNGTYTTTNGQIGKVRGTLPKYQYFYTYRLIGDHYDSILPYSKLTDFNFVKNGNVDNVSLDSQLNITIPNLKWLIDSVNLVGFRANDLEVIIGKYLNEDNINPQKITGIGDIVVIPITELINSRSLKTFGVQSNFSDLNNSLKIFKQDLDNFVAKIGGVGAYNKTTNPNGDPTYNIYDNYEHYTYTNGDPMPSDLVVGRGKWTLGNLKYRTQVEKYRSSIQLTIPAEQWNDTTNPTYDPTNTFIKDRFISEVAIVFQDSLTKTEKPMIYAKIAPAIRKTTDLDILINLTTDF